VVEGLTSRQGQHIVPQRDLLPTTTPTNGGRSTKKKTTTALAHVTPPKKTRPRRP
jgi:hypothetical protein